MPFMNTPVVQFIDGDRWKLVEDLIYVTRNIERIDVPKGFITDFASIPRVLWTLVGEPSGPWGPAAVVHDFIYQTGFLPRVEADQVFRDAMIELGVRRTKAWLMWAAVRTAGWRFYHAPGSVDDKAA
jgi:hypothetical protein